MFYRMVTLLMTVSETQLPPNHVNFYFGIAFLSGGVKDFKFRKYVDHSPQMTTNTQKVWSVM